MTTSAAKTVKLDHVACGVPSITAAVPLLEGCLGARPYRGGPSADFRGAQWAFEGGGLLELIEPLGPEDGFLQRFLQTRGPGIHHVTLKVPDIHAARTRAQGAGYEVIGFSDANPSWKECFLHPRQALGLVVQMAASDPDVVSDTWVEFAPTVSPPHAGPAAALLGLKLAARSLDAALRLWCDAGCATSVRRENKQAFFTWDGSPLTIHVIETDTCPEGPLGLEVRLPPGMQLEHNPPPSIGALLIF